MQNLLCRNLSLLGSDAEAKRAEVLDYFLKTYEIYERLFDILLDDSVFYEQPEKLRHPIIFYFGHTAAFYINKLIFTGKISRVNERFESIFAIGVDEMSWDDLNSSNYTWPSVADTRAYREKVKEIVVEFIKTEPLKLPICWSDPFWIVLMGIEHERIHLETSSVLMRQLDVGLLKESEIFKLCTKSSNPPTNELLNVAGGVVKLGKKRTDDYYGWDNEYGYFETKLDGFLASKYLVSNGEFLEFVRDGGYGKDEFWSDEGLSWRKFTGAIIPCFWHRNGLSYKYRALNSVIDMPMDWPVDVNYHEAKAYCNWLGARTSQNLRLPTEAEWYRLLEYSGAVDVVLSSESGVRANINLEHFASACPVDTFAHGDFYDVVGNVWQWCETPIYPFDGFEVHSVYDDFSVPTFDDRHNLIKGGSFISTGNESLPSARYAFRRHFFQHAGFRYVSSNNPLEDTNANYENDSEVTESLEFGYGSMNNFSTKIAQVVADIDEGVGKGRVLDLGCSVGRSSFELARVFEEVIGVDFSARFIRCGEHIKKDGRFRYVSSNGEKKEVCADDFGITPQMRERVKFWQGDSCNLKPVFAEFDFIVAANLLEKLYSPVKFLSGIHNRLGSGGIFVLASTYNWNERYTKKQDWLSNDAHSALPNIRKILELNFDEVGEVVDIEFVSKSHTDGFNHFSSEMTVWRKK